MPTPALRKGLADLIEAERARAERMLEVLGLEREALARRDFPAIEQAAAEKERLIAALESLAERQTAALRSAGVTVTGGRLGEALERAGLPDLVPLWDDLQDLLGQCRQQNLVNGGVIEMSRRFAREVLATLRGTAPGSDLYGRCGERRHTDGGEPLATA
ncbi:MAG: flagellar protein FlgN [Gammaproteobacteria bacterium]|jgi:flagella synthesis protein FlgN|nr:flagellar protein FlgN [Gammaproteobacteria bacterium]